MTEEKNECQNDGTEMNRSTIINNSILEWPVCGNHESSKKKKKKQCVPESFESCMAAGLLLFFDLRDGFCIVSISVENHQILRQSTCCSHE